MRKLAYLLLIALLTFSCEKDVSISEELLGDWIYERETFNNAIIFQDIDTEGFMLFRSDMTGNWNHSNVLLSFTLEWELMSDDTQIEISKKFINESLFPPLIRVYDITMLDENTITLTYHMINEDFPEFEEFENIILTRME